LALAAIAATVLSALAAQIFTYPSNRDMSSEEFQRTERRNAYAELNGKATDLENAEDHANTDEIEPVPIDGWHAQVLLPAYAHDDGGLAGSTA